MARNIIRVTKEQQEAAGFSSPEEFSQAQTDFENQPNLPVPQPPTSVDQINQVGEFQLPRVSPVTPDLSEVRGRQGFFESQISSEEERAKSAQAQADEIRGARAEDTQPFLQRLLGGTKPSEARSEALEETGIGISDFFNTQKAGLAEIGKLDEEFNKNIALRDEQIARIEENRGGALRPFVDAEVARVEKNAAIKLNQISANIKGKSAVMEAQQGNFELAKSLAHQAANDATADLQFASSQFRTVWDLNKDVLENLDKEYVDAYKGAMDASEKRYQEAREDKNQVGELMINNPEAGITMNDSLTSARQKIVATGGVSTADEQKEAKNFLSDAASFVEKLESGKISWGAAFDSLKTQYPTASNALIDNTLNKTKRFEFTVE